MCSSPSAPGFDEIAGGPWNNERLYSSKASPSPIGFEIHSTFKKKKVFTPEHDICEILGGMSTKNVNRIWSVENNKLVNLS